MLQTLFTIPHEIAGLPVFGMGWLLIIWGLASLVIVTSSVMQHGWGGETSEWLRLLAVIGVAVGFVMPFLEVDDPLQEGRKLGLSIRGYGVMMLLGVLSGVGMAIQRGRRMGYHPDTILSICVWMFVWGIVGARLFYVIQYWDRFYVAGDLAATLQKLVKFTEGGLVVYGAVIGAVGAAFFVVMRNKIAVLEIADIISPAMLVGLALGRLGCFFNGCCWGGACELDLPTVQFPVGSPPYMAQLESGRLIGLDLEKRGEDENASYLVKKVAPDSPLIQKGIKEGETYKLEMLAGDELKARWRLAQKNKDRSGTERVHPALAFENADGGVLRLLPEELPSRSRRIHPSQIYSVINASLLVLLMYAYFPYRKRHGEIFVLTMTLYPITRTLLEIIRNDEIGQLGTSLTVSQWVSVLFLLGIVALWVYIVRQPPRKELVPAA